MKKKSLLILCITLSGVDAFAQQSKERFFHNIYNKYYSQPTENFEAVLNETEIERSYVIQRGDNLYDISSTLFGSPDFWPKIWSLNNDTFGNPHLIFEGNRVYFTEGTIEEAPDIIIQENKIDQVVTKTEAVKIPPLSKKSIGPIELPPSLPRFIIDAEAEKEEFKAVSSLNMKSRKSYLDPLRFKARSIISTKYPRSDGQVKGIFRGGNNASIGETVIIKSKTPLELQTSLVTFNIANESKLKALLGLETYIIQRTGVLRIDKDLGKSRYLAEVVDSYGFVGKGNDFYVGSLKDIVIKKGDLPKALVTGKSVNVIGGELIYGRRVLGTGDIVYLDKGTNANLEEGGLYLVYTNRRSKVFEAGATYAKNMPISLAKVIHVEKSVASAVLVDTVDEVSEGDYLNIRERNAF